MALLSSRKALICSATLNNSQQTTGGGWCAIQNATLLWIGIRCSNPFDTYVWYAPTHCVPLDVSVRSFTSHRIRLNARGHFFAYTREHWSIHVSIVRRAYGHVCVYGRMVTTECHTRKWFASLLLASFVAVDDLISRPQRNATLSILFSCMFILDLCACVYVARVERATI